MKRFASALVLGLGLFSFVGCGEESGVKQETTTTTPGGGSQTVTKETSVETDAGAGGAGATGGAGGATSPSTTPATP